MNTQRRYTIITLSLCFSILLAVWVTWPLAAQLGSASRVDSGDGRHGVWNVAWVAQALTTHPARLYEANIFYPAKQALAFSEANVVAGIMAVPAWLLSRGNPYVAYNSVVLMAFVLAALSGYILARTVGASRAGSIVAAITWGYSPYMLAHIPHIQLLMLFGPALSLAAMHRFIDMPTTPRAVILGGVLGVTGLACAYYGIFSGLIVTLGVLWFAVTDGLWRQLRFWGRVALAALVGTVIILPFLLPYVSIRDEGFGRSLADARLFSEAGWGYLASPVLVHQWMLPLLGAWREVLFPGFHAVLLSAMAVPIAWRHRTRAHGRMAGFYLLMMAFAFWFSLGPDAGLYSLLYHVFPLLSFLRVPARMGVMVTLGAAVLAGLALTWWQPGRATLRRLTMAAVLIIALAESWAGPLLFKKAPRVDKVYHRLAMMPKAPVAEFPFFRGAGERHMQTEYMLMSTFHWQPLLNGYSDHLPSDYLKNEAGLNTFPSPEAIALLQQQGIRWVVVHFNLYPIDYKLQMRALMRTVGTHLREVIDDTEVGLYEVIFPMRPAVARRP